MSAILVMLVFPVLLALAAGYDLASYTIPNVLPLALGVGFMLFALFAGLPAGVFGWHFAAGAAALILGFGLFAAGVIGGGDAKLFAATALWFGFSDLTSYALTAAVLGGALTLLLLTARHSALPAGLFGHAWISRLLDQKSGVPYGVALAAGALVVLPQAEIFRMVAAG